MQIHYNSKTDLLYITLDDRDQQVLNREIAEDVILDINDKEKIVGIEIINASKHLDLQQLLPVHQEKILETV